MYKKIIVPVEIGQLDKGEKIMRKAKALLDEGGEIIAMNVTENIPGYLAIDLPIDFIETSVKDADAKLQELTKKCEVTAKVEVRIGSSAHEILACAEAHEADLILIASHRPDFTNYLIGSTADRVVRHAKCSVLVDR